MKHTRIKLGFTMLELIIVIVILGILAAIALVEYGRSVERSRIAEARMVLGRVRDAEVVYYLDHQAYGDLTDLSYEPPTTCTSTHYFRYSASAGSNIGTATRCVAGDGGKTDGPSAYTVTVNYDTGDWSGNTAGFY